MADSHSGAPPSLTPADLRRYARHLTLPEVGSSGQARLKAGRVLVVGAGGLGSPAALYLAAAGVGTLGVADFDAVDESNLHRQILFGQSDVGRPKLEAAVERLRETNPLIEIVPHNLRLGAGNALEVLAGYDVILDGSDNFSTRYLVNDACVRLGKPDVWGAISRFEGQLAVFWAARGPCYRCLFPEPPPFGLVPSCAEAGVLGVLPGIIGALQANEAIKLVLGAGEPIIGRLLLFDALRLQFRELRLPKNPECPVCAGDAGAVELVDYEEVCAPASANAGEQDESTISVPDLATWLREERSFTLLDVRLPEEHAQIRLPGSVLIPLHELPARLSELDPAQPIVAYCHLGMRSAQAEQFLRRSGFPRVWSLAGGMAAWESASGDPLTRPQVKSGRP